MLIKIIMIITTVITGNVTVVYQRAVFKKLMIKKPVCAFRQKNIIVYYYHAPAAQFGDINILTGRGFFPCILRYKIRCSGVIFPRRQRRGHIIQ
jgi:hypothetical protein